VTYCGLIPKVIKELAMAAKKQRCNGPSIIDIDGWGYSPRGAGYLFGGDVVQKVSCTYLSIAIYDTNEA
jgi:hypothetical protein